MTNLADYNERQRALDPQRSFIVQAPAGSGKTELLTQRYLTLLTHVTEPEEVVAITFTRKAAAEMRARILETLQEPAKLEASTEPHAQQKLALINAVLKKNKQQNWDLLNQPHRLRIQTIDAFCASLTKQLPILSRFGAQPEICEDPELLYRRAAQIVLSYLEQDVPWATDIANLFLHLDNDYQKVENLLCSMLAKRDQWLTYIVSGSQADNLREILEHGLKQTIIETIAKLNLILPKALLPNLFECANFAASHIKKIKPDSLIIYCDQLSVCFGYTEQDLQHLPVEQLETIKNVWLGLAELLLTKDNQWRSRLTKNEGFLSATEIVENNDKVLFKDMKTGMLTIIAELTENTLLHDYLQTLRILPPSNYSDEQWNIIVSLLTLLPILVAQLQIIFQESQEVDYIEVAHCALQALGESDNPTDLALYLDYKIKHILVDEFQDTSSTQFHLLEQLTSGWETNDGRTLFLVGDPMQSIYRFRKAEVGLFLRAWQKGIGQISLTPITLSVNFRSDKHLITWVNETFVKLMPQTMDIASSAVPYSPSQTNKTFEERSVNLCSFTEDGQTEAQYIIQTVKEILEKKSTNSLAILVRARNHLSEIIPQLQKANIPYRAVEIETLNQTQVIQDLLALTRALLHISDRVAWLAILRAPWCGLTLDELKFLVGEDYKLTIWERLQTLDFTEFSSPTNENLCRTFAILDTSLKQQGRLPLANWVRGTWLALGGPTALLHKNDLKNADLFFDLLAEFPTPESLIDISLLEKKLSALFAKPQANSGFQVEVMTIHKAKGLEFDTVILPGLERLLPADSQQLLLCTERLNHLGNADLLLAPIKASSNDEDPIYNYLRFEEKKRAHYETLRLLYVAVTRAKQHLHLLTTLKKDDSHPYTIKEPIKNSLIAYLWPMHSDSFLQNLITKSTEVINHNNRQSSFRRLPKDWQLPTLDNGEVPIFNLSNTPPSIKKIIYKWSNASQQQIGIIVHQFLQQISLEGLEHWSEKRILQSSKTIQNLLLYQGIDTKEIKNVMDTVIQALLNAITDEKGRWILNSKHQDSQAEFSLTAQISNETTQIIIDRTFIDANNVRWIIDYKIIHAEENLDQFIERAVQTYRNQLEEYARIIQTFSPSQEIRLGLYFPLSKTWREWVYRKQ